MHPGRIEGKASYDLSFAHVDTIREVLLSRERRNIVENPKKNIRNILARKLSQMRRLRGPSGNSKSLDRKSQGNSKHKVPTPVPNISFRISRFVFRISFFFHPTKLTSNSYPCAARRSLSITVAPSPCSSTPSTTITSTPIASSSRRVRNK